VEQKKGKQGRIFEKAPAEKGTKPPGQGGQTKEAPGWKELSNKLEEKEPLIQSTSILKGEEEDQKRGGPLK